jgi:hypothetical protein
LKESQTVPIFGFRYGDRDLTGGIKDNRIRVRGSEGTMELKEEDTRPTEEYNDNSSSFIVITNLRVRYNSIRQVSQLCASSSYLSAESDVLG